MNPGSVVNMSVLSDAGPHCRGGIFEDPLAESIEMQFVVLGVKWD